MRDRNSEKKIRLVYLFLPLLILIGFFLNFNKVNNTSESGFAFASQNTVSDSYQPKDTNEPSDPNRPQHTHPAFSERIEERQRMVKSQIQARDVKDPNVLKAMRIVPRHAFVRSSEKSVAYIDSPLPIDFEQTISQPYIVGFMTQALKLDPNSKVLEIGTGSGYQAAVCAEIAREVYTIEIVEGLAKIAKERLKELGYPNVFVRAGDGFFGWKEHAPYDAIIGTAAAGRVPEPLIEQLKPGGRMILPVGSSSGLQELVIITKDQKGNLKKETVLPVRFVPMTGEVQKSDK
jgi:protein-L-isoaspartate(D-aspartate) O-methyltransferase